MFMLYDQCYSNGRQRQWLDLCEMVSHAFYYSRPSTNHPYCKDTQTDRQADRQRGQYWIGTLTGHHQSVHGTRTCIQADLWILYIGYCKKGHSTRQRGTCMQRWNYGDAHDAFRSEASGRPRATLEIALLDRKHR